MPGIAACFGAQSEQIVRRLLDGFNCRVGGDHRVHIGAGFALAALGQEPISVGRSAAVIDGVVHNYGQLAEEMRAEGHKLSTTEPAEVMCALYGDFGPDGGRLLDGEFSLILAGEEGEPYLCRDRYSATPLFYGLTDSGVFVAASERQGVEAMATQVTELPPATYYSGSTGELTYFEPPRGSAYISDEAAALALVGYHLLEAIERRIGRAERVAVLGDRGTASKLISAYTHQLGADVEVFVAAAKSAAAGESAEALGIKVTEVDSSHAPTKSLKRCASATAVPDEVVSLAALARAAVDAGHTVLLTAAGSDELFGGAHIAPEATPEETHDLLRQRAADRRFGTFAAVAAASAASGVYIRAVFADPNVAMTAWELSPLLKYHDGRPGWPLERLLTRTLADVKVLTP
jgi:asparagine synthetase B (glutamine-hydrolysing)